MFEFDNIESSEDTLNIIPRSPTSIDVVTPNSELLDGQITPFEESLPTVETLYDIEVSPLITEDIPTTTTVLAGNCDVSKFYGEHDGTFKIQNLFSELVDDYQRFVARQNLGIGEEASLLWGNIKGNLASQADLYLFILETIQSQESDLIEELNLKLSQWGYDINRLFDDKADLNSPIFSGVPKVPTPNINSSSEQVATTAWVNSKIEQLYGQHLTNFALSDSYMFYGDAPIELTCTWGYDAEITSQTINGISVGTEITSHTFSDVSISFTINLVYVIDGVSYSKTASFDKLLPTYSGTHTNYIYLNKTGGNTLTLECGDEDYGYLLIPNKSEARISVDGLVGGFVLEGSATIWGNTYYVYKTVNYGLGKLYITIL